MSYQPQPTQPPKKKRVFLWVFLAIQALFVIWIITGVAGSSTSTGDCGSLTAQQCSDAQTVGTGLGVSVILCVWAVVDVVVGGGYAVIRLAKRP